MHLLKRITTLRNGSIRQIIDKRIDEFRELKEKGNREIFKELCFCILTANFNAERSIEIQKGIGDGLIYESEEELALKLRKMGHRFPETRAEYIVEARRFQDSIKEILASLDERDYKREWLVKNIKGIGYKESSHFLRNIGYLDYAIIDFHIIDLLEKEGMIERPKTLTKKRYLMIESLLRDVAERVNMAVGELDLYLWYMETGKVLK